VEGQTVVVEHVSDVDDGVYVPRLERLLTELKVAFQFVG
jgi:hypothetical protein